jgi:AraC-like DNA-binding protein
MDAVDPLRGCPRALGYYQALRRVEEYVRAHLEDPISLEEAAAVADLRPKYFSHFFREKVSLTFTEWLAAQRVARAAAMLRERDCPIERLAEAVGFRSRRTCQRWFKRFTGMTPRQFKHQVRPS